MIAGAPELPQQTVLAKKIKKFFKKHGFLCCFMQ
jgi:hypothetical protein